MCNLLWKQQWSYHNDHKAWLPTLGIPVTAGNHTGHLFKQLSHPVAQQLVLVMTTCLKANSNPIKFYVHNFKDLAVGNSGIQQYASVDSYYFYSTHGDRQSDEDLVWRFLGSL